MHITIVFSRDSLNNASVFVSSELTLAETRKWVYDNFAWVSHIVFN